MEQFRTDQQICFSFFPEQQEQHNSKIQKKRLISGSNSRLDNKRIFQINWAREYRNFQNSFTKRGYPQKAQDWTLEFQQKKRQLSKYPSQSNIQYQSPPQKGQQIQHLKRHSQNNIQMNKSLVQQKTNIKPHLNNSFSKRSTSEFQEWQKKYVTAQNKENEVIQNQEPLLYVNIYFRDISDSIVIYKNDSIEKLLQDFSKKHNLDGIAKEKFKLKFLSQIHELLQSNDT